MQKKLFIIAGGVLCLSIITTGSAFGRSGCCSSHEDVRADGCGCNDGTPLSATCAAYYTCTAANDYTAPVQQTVQYQPTVYIPTAIPTQKPKPTIKPKAKKVVKKQIKKKINKPKPTPTPKPKRFFGWF